MTKTLLAVFAVTVMLGCSLVPLVSEGAEGTEAAVAKDVPELSLKEIIGTVADASRESNTIISENGMVLVRVDDSKFVDVTEEVGTEITEETHIGKDAASGKGQSLTLDGTYMFSGDGKIIVDEGARLNICPLDGTNKCFAINNIDADNEIISMAYGSYLTIFGITFQFLFACNDVTTDHITLLTMSKNYGLNCDFNSTGEFKFIIDTKLAKIFDVQIKDGGRDERGLMVSAIYLKGGTIAKTENGISISNCHISLASPIREVDSHHHSIMAANDITYFELSYGSETITGNDDMTVKSGAKISLETTSLAFGRYNYDYAGRFMVAMTTRGDWQIHLKNVPIDVNTEVTKKGDARDVKRVTDIGSGEEFWFKFDNPSFSAGTVPEKEGYDFIKYRFGVGAYSDTEGKDPTMIALCYAVVDFNGFSIHSERSGVGMTSDRLEMDVDKITISFEVPDKDLQSIQFNIGADYRWDNDRWMGSVDYYWKTHYIMKLEMVMTDLKVRADQSKITVGFDMNITGSMDFGGIDKSISLNLTGFECVANVDSKDIAFSFKLTSLDVSNTIPLCKSAIIGKESSLSYQDAEHSRSYSENYVENLSGNDYVGTLRINNLEYSESVLSVGKLEIALNDYVNNNKIVGDIKIDANGLSVKQEEDEDENIITTINCDEATGSYKNPYCNTENFSIKSNGSDKPELIVENGVIELSKGKAVFGGGTLPLNIIIGDNANFTANGLEVISAMFESKAKVSGSIGCYFAYIGKTNVTMLNTSPSAYSFVLNLDTLADGTVGANKGYSLPATYSGDGFTLDSGKITITSKGGQLIDLNIPCDRSSYKVSYEGNVTEEMTYNTGDLVKVTDKTANRSNYRFIGWTDGSGTIYESGDEFIMPSHDVNLTPVYMNLEPTITYHKEGEKTIAVINGGDADIVKNPLIDLKDADLYIFKTKNVTMSVKESMINEFRYFKALNIDHLNDEVAAKNTEGMILYDISILDVKGNEINNTGGAAQFEITFNIGSKGSIKELKSYIVDDNGKMFNVTSEVIKDGNGRDAAKVTTLHFGIVALDATFGDYDNGNAMPLLIIIAIVAVIACIGFVGLCAKKTKQ